MRIFRHFAVLALGMTACTGAHGAEFIIAPPGPIGHSRTADQHLRPAATTTRFVLPTRDRGSAGDESVSASFRAGYERASWPWMPAVSVILLMAALGYVRSRGTPRERN